MSTKSRTRHRYPRRFCERYALNVELRLLRVARNMSECGETAARAARATRELDAAIDRVRESICGLRDRSGEGAGSVDLG